MKNAFIFTCCLLLQCLCFAATPLTQFEGLDLVSNKSIKVDISSSSKSTVLVFLSAKCPCSASHEELLNKLAIDFKDFAFIGIHSNADEALTDSASHFEKAHMNFPILQDSKTIWANHFGALKTPHAFVLNTKGEILYQGGVTDSHVGPSAKTQFLRVVLEDIQNGKAPRFKEGRALGCFIQREE